MAVLTTDGFGVRLGGGLVGAKDATMFDVKNIRTDTKSNQPNIFRFFFKFEAFDLVSMVAPFAPKTNLLLRDLYYSTIPPVMR